MPAWRRRWCMLIVPHGKKRTTDRREARAREGADRTPSAEGGAPTGRKGKKRRATVDADGDPDIAHIKPGPQPLADWQIEE